MKTLFSILLLLLLSLTFTYSQTAKQYYERGLAKEELKEYKGAIADYTKAIGLNPKYSEAYSGRGFVKGELNDHIGAITDYNKALENSPESIEDYYGIYSGRGSAKYNLKDYRGAIEDLTKAIEASPKHEYIYMLRGYAKIKLNQKESGCLDFSKSGELGNKEAYEAIKKYCQ